ncbi:MAG: hypothetical protein JW940_34985 [Polyangiaceae bacterium]|nr:hypothetical protein [Polyangiaceae bacterium]
MTNASTCPRRGFLVGALSLAAVTALPSTSRADNPIVQTLYTADPAPMVHEGTLYVFIAGARRVLGDAEMAGHVRRLHAHRLADAKPNKPSTPKTANEPEPDRPVGRPSALRYDGTGSSARRRNR